MLIHSDMWCCAESTSLDCHYYDDSDINADNGERRDVDNVAHLCSTPVTSQLTATFNISVLSCSRVHNTPIMFISSSEGSSAYQY